MNRRMLLAGLFSAPVAAVASLPALGNAAALTGDRGPEIVINIRDSAPVFDPRIVHEHIRSLVPRYMAECTARGGWRR